MKIGEEVVHSSRRSSKSYLCTESGQPQTPFVLTFGCRHSTHFG